MTNVATMTGAAVSNDRGDMRHVVARLERLPYCSWHLKMRLIICTAWFFDAFNSIAIAVVLPPLIGMWHLVPQQIGPLIGIGFLGQLVGAIAFGWIAEKWGRRSSMLATLLIFSLGALACAAATSYTMLFWLRFVQGIGLGGEIPLMAAYVNEFAHAKNRGRFSVSIQVLFSVGLMAVALVGVYVVPHWGWQWMFIIGAVPGLIAIPMRLLLPESPRWLASQGRYDEADQAISRIEGIAAHEGLVAAPLPAEIPPVAEARPKVADLFKGIYLRRTIAVWFIWIGAYFVSYGITAWMPTLFRTVYHLSVQQSLNYGLINNVFGLCGAFMALYLIEAIGRRRMFVLSLGGCAISAHRVRVRAAAQRRRNARVGVPAVSSSSAPPCIARDLYGGDLSDPIARAWRRRRQLVSARRIGGGHHRCRLGAAVLWYQRRLRDVRTVCVVGGGHWPSFSPSRLARKMLEHVSPAVSRQLRPNR